jgi:hypothetical protein
MNKLPQRTPRVEVQVPPGFFSRIVLPQFGGRQPIFCLGVPVEWMDLDPNSLVKQNVFDSMEGTLRQDFQLTSA